MKKFPSFFDVNLREKGILYFEMPMADGVSYLKIDTSSKPSTCEEIVYKSIKIGRESDSNDVRNLMNGYGFQRWSFTHDDDLCAYLETLIEYTIKIMSKEYYYAIKEEAINWVIKQVD